MRRSVTAIPLLAIGLTLVACARESAGPPPSPQPQQRREPNMKEFAILPVGMIDDGSGGQICGLLESPPDPILTHKAGARMAEGAMRPDAAGQEAGPQTGAGQAEWIVVGNCRTGDTIAVDDTLWQNGTAHEGLIQVTGPDTVAASHGSRLKVVVLPQTGDGDYEYQVLINGESAQAASPAARGVFAICPDWPCQRSR